MWNVNVLTLFPEMFPGMLGYSLSGKGLENRIWDIKTTQIRDFAKDKHKMVDDTCYGPNAGMLMKPDVVHDALTHAKSTFHGVPKIIYMSPRGVPLKQKMVHEFANSDGLIILCGRYEGIDNRVIEHWKETDELIEVSIGDYILSGGEVAAMVLIDSCVRLLPNIVHSKESLISESFELDLLEFSQYTKPYSWHGKVVPDILLSGDHKKIAAWQKNEAENVTKVRRPDLWETYLNNCNNLEPKE